jgi:hypothetical protein
MGLKFNPTTQKLDLVNPATAPAGSNTQIQFNSNGVFGADSNLIWDATNHRLGIKVASPSYDFQIGDYSTDYFMSLCSQNVGKSQIRLNHYSDKYGFTIENNSIIGGGWGTFNILRHFGSSAGTAAFTLKEDTGFAGIWTAAPSCPFEVTGNTYINGAISIGTQQSFNSAMYLCNGYGGGTEIRFTNTQTGGGDWSFGTGYSYAGGVGNWYFYKNGTNSGVKMVFDVSGNIGMGVVSPTAVVHIKAGVAAAGGAPLKFTAGVLNTTQELGSMEFTDDGTVGHLYITRNIAGVLTRSLII